MTPAVFPAPLHYRALQEQKNTALIGPVPFILCPHYIDTESKTRFDVVEEISETAEISEYPTEESSSDAGIRCFRFGLGSSIIYVSIRKY